MAFEGLKDQLSENWADLSSKIQENSAFNTAREKFESQSPTVQRAIIAAIAFAVVMFLFSFPWGYISTSQENMVEFEGNRELIQGLLRASRSAKEPSPLPTPIDSGALKGQVDAVIRENRLLPEQIGEINPLAGDHSKAMAPAGVIQTGLVVQLKKLNLDQITVLANGFQNMGPGIKLIGLDVVQSAGQTHYYDMISRLVHFALPALDVVDEGPDEPKKGAKKPKRKTEEETIE